MTATDTPGKTVTLNILFRIFASQARMNAIKTGDI